jgi:type I restriction enzyme R subunit
MGVQEEDLFLSLANRLIRLDKQLSEQERDKLLEYSGGKDIKQITRELIAAFDPDAIEASAQKMIAAIPEADRSPAQVEEAQAKAQEKLILQAASTFNGPLNDYLENVRKEHEQIIDHINLDRVTKSEWDTTSAEQAQSIIGDFQAYLEANKDEIKALSIFYDQPYKRREITFKMIKEVMDKIKLEKPTLAPAYVWNAYATLEEVKSEQPKDELTALVSLIRRACGIDGALQPFDKTINKNFQQWILQQNAGQHNRFTPEQMDWLRMLKEHIVSSYHIELDDLDYTPFDAKGGRGKMYQLFGAEMTNIIDELNEVLAA